MSDRSRRRSPLAVQLLLLLAEQPMHAYEMQRLIKARQKDRIVNIAQRNSVYQTLERMVRAGFVEVQETVQEHGRPERTVYRLTGAGHEAVEEWVETMVSTPAREFPEFPVALAALPHLTPDRAADLLDRRVATLEERRREAAADAARTDEMGLPRLFMLEEEYQRALTEAELSWVRGLVDDLRAGRLTWDEAWLEAVAEQFGGPRT